MQVAEPARRGEDVGVESFSERLDYLFRTVRPRNREYTYEEIAARVRDRGGEEISGTYISMLRRGLRDNPTRRHIEGLAAAFGVPPNFFFDQTAAEEIAAKLELLASMRDAGVQRVALRASELSPEGLRAIQSMVEHVRRIEGLPAEDD